MEKPPRGILDGMERALTRIEAEFPDAGTATLNGGFTVEIVDRWAFDKEYGLPADMVDLTAEDHAALADLANGSAASPIHKKP